MAWHEIGEGTAKELIALVNLEIIRRETDRPETKQVSLREFETELRERMTVSDRAKAYLAAAREFYHSDGDLEFDEGNLVSMGDDDGAYVMGWKWVSNDDACICDNCGEPYEDGADGFDGKCPSCADYEAQVEDPDSYFGVDEWKDEVAAGDTTRGYEDWKAAQIEQAKEALKQRTASHE